MTYAEICRIGNNSLLRPDNIRPRLEAKVQTTQEVPTGFFFTEIWHCTVIKRYVFIKVSEYLL